MDMPSAVALIPARAGSQRVPGKNARELAGHPLIAYTIAAARLAEVFEAIVVSTDSEEIAAVSGRYGAEVPGLRPEEMATSTSPDIEWLRHTLAELSSGGRNFEIFSILRATSPFRGPETIRRAFEQLVALGDKADSVRAVRPCREHPGKMWVVDGELSRGRPRADVGRRGGVHAAPGGPAGRCPVPLPPVRVAAARLRPGL